MEWERAMQNDPGEEDVKAIAALVVRQFSSLNWQSDRPADWSSFAADFLQDASLYPSARPAKRQTVEGFIERMKSLAGTTLRSFHETVLGTEIRVFGNVAVAVAACEMIENGTQVNRGVEMLLLVKDQGVWRIVSQAWDTESPFNRISPSLLGTAAEE
jgi:hypothetical protein